MSFRRQLALVSTVLPLAFYAYACSDDDPSPSPDDPDGPDGGSVQETGSEEPGPETPDGGDTEEPADGGADASEQPTCVGNPLLSDGGVSKGIVVAFNTLKAIGEGLFLDGPQWIDEPDGGAIVYSEVINQQVVRNGPDGGTRAVLSTTTSLPIGNARVGDFLYTAVSDYPGPGGGIRRTLLDGGSPTGFDAGPAKSPNDLVGSSKGFVYFTDPGYQTSDVDGTGVYRLAPDGGISTVATYAGSAEKPDGVALTRDESTLYVGYFQTNRIVRFTVDANGGASNPQELTFKPTHQPTGLAVDFAGNLWIAENVDDATAGRIEVVDPEGEKWGEILFPDSKPTGIAFGGADGKTVYVTTERGSETLGTLYVLSSSCAGVR